MNSRWTTEKYLGVLVLAMCVFFSPAAAQFTLQAGVGGGLGLPQGDYSGSTIDYYAGTAYGLSTGYNAHGKVRLGALGLRFTGEVGYSSFNNTGEATPGQGKVEVTHNILSFKVGPEYTFSIPQSPITPYVGAHAAAHIISGETVLQSISQVSSGTYELPSATRIGLGGSVGATLSLGPVMNLDLAVHYEAVNLFGKKWEDPNPNNDQRIDSYLALNDDADPLYAVGDTRHFISDSRSISVLYFTVTLMFGL